MKLIEKIGLGLIALSIVLRLFFVPGGVALCLLSIFLTAMLYFAGGFWLLGISDKKKGSKQNMIGLSIGAGFAISFGLVAILFKVMFWPGAEIEAVGASVFVFLLLIASLILLYHSQNRKAYYKLLSIRAAVLLVLLLFCIYTSSNSIYSVFHRNDPLLVQKWIYMNEHPGDPAAIEDFYNYQDTR